MRCWRSRPLPRRASSPRAPSAQLAAALALALAACSAREDRSTPERAFKTCFDALVRDDPRTLSHCYGPDWQFPAWLAHAPPADQKKWARYRREVLAGSSVEIAALRPAKDGDPAVVWLVPRYRRRDGGTEEDHALWTKMLRVDGQWVIDGEANDLFE